MRKSLPFDLSILSLPSTVCTDGYRWAGVMTGDNVYVINSEGVGWDIADVYAGADRAMQQDFGCSIDDIRRQISDADNGFVSLAEHIRTFGSRLESNHYMWHALLADKFATQGVTTLKD